jgi:hypothetical protein
MSASLTGNDVVKIDSRVFADLADGDAVNLDYANNVVEVKTGKNRNRIYAFNATGETVVATIRVIRGSSDDKFLNGKLVDYLSDSSLFTLMNAEFVKRVGDGLGNITNEIYKLEGGVVQKYPNVKTNVEGDTEQAVAEYTVIFSNTQRTLA